MIPRHEGRFHVSTTERGVSLEDAIKLDGTKDGISVGIKTEARNRQKDTAQCRGEKQRQGEAEVDEEEASPAEHELAW